MCASVELERQEVAFCGSAFELGCVAALVCKRDFVARLHTHTEAKMESAQSAEFRELLNSTTCDRRSLGRINATQSAMAIYWKKMDVKEHEFSKLLCPLKELGPVYGLYSKLVAFGATVALPSTTFEVLKDRIQHALSHGVVRVLQDTLDIPVSITCRLEDTLTVANMVSAFFESIGQFRSRTLLRGRVRGYYYKGHSPLDASVSVIVYTQLGYSQCLEHFQQRCRGTNYSLKSPTFQPAALLELRGSRSAKHKGSSLSRLEIPLHPTVPHCEIVETKKVSKDASVEWVYIPLNPSTLTVVVDTDTASVGSGALFPDRAIRVISCSVHEVSLVR